MSTMTGNLASDDEVSALSGQDPAIDLSKFRVSADDMDQDLECWLCDGETVARNVNELTLADLGRAAAQHWIDVHRPAVPSLKEATG